MIKPTIPNIHRTPETERENLIDLSRNERLTPFPEWFLGAIELGITNGLLSKYPDQIPLKRKLAKSLGVSEDMVLLTNGADAAVKAIYHVYVKPGDRIATLSPTYAMYEVYAKMFGATIVGMEEKSDLIIVANPNQPTGMPTPFHLEIAKSPLWVIDETYRDFYYLTAIPFLKTWDNLIIIRSFSKGAGIAGLRLGYVIAHPEIIANLARVRSCYDVNSMALMVGELILDHPEVVEEHVASVKAGAQVLAEKAREMGLEPILPVVTNFMLIRFPHQVDKVVSKLKAKGYAVKGSFKDECLKNMIRVTLGPPALMEEFGKALSEVINNPPDWRDWPGDPDLARKLGMG